MGKSRQAIPVTSCMDPWGEFRKFFSITRQESKMVGWTIGQFEDVFRIEHRDFPAMLDDQLVVCFLHWYLKTHQSLSGKVHLKTVCMFLAGRESYHHSWMVKSGWIAAFHPPSFHWREIPQFSTTFGEIRCVTSLYFTHAYTHIKRNVEIRPINCQKYASTFKVRGYPQTHRQTHRQFTSEKPNLGNKKGIFPGI